jgi:hypothetical protein
MRFSSKFLILFIFATVAAGHRGQSQADFAIGSIIKDFALPQRDSQGAMKLQIFGEQATIISTNRIKVEKLHIELYQDGRPDVRIESPESDFWKLENRLTTNHGVQIQHPSFALTAARMDWELNENRGLFQGGVTLTVQKRDAITPEILKP